MHVILKKGIGRIRDSLLSGGAIRNISMQPNQHNNYAILTAQRIIITLAMKTFAEAGEDKLILKHFYSRIKSGFIGHYLDIGCFHDTERSTTKLLHICGWNGVALDANPELKDHWLHKRPNDVFINAAILPSLNSEQYKKTKGKIVENKIKFYRFIGAQISTINQDLAEEKANSGSIPRDIISVECISLKDLGLLLKSKLPLFRPDFLNIDIEQVDYLDDLSFFLESVNFPEYLCLETITANFDCKAERLKESKILLELGYSVKPVGCNLHCIRID